jgi:hypothetical protein
MQLACYQYFPLDVIAVLALATVFIMVIILLVYSHLKKIKHWEITRLNENNIYNYAWKQSINIATDQTV